MKRNASAALSNAFQGLRISSTARPAARVAPAGAFAVPNHVRLLSTTPARLGTWLEPSIDRTKKMMKGRPRVATGGSTKGTTVMWGDYGLRMDDHHRRISAKHLKMAEDTIKARLRGQKYRLYKRVCCNVGVYTSGNEVKRIPQLRVRNSGMDADSGSRLVWVRVKVLSTIGRRGLR